MEDQSAVTEVTRPPLPPLCDLASEAIQSEGLAFKAPMRGGWLELGRGLAWEVGVTVSISLLSI
jgi:hypothetical protein